MDDHDTLVELNIKVEQLEEIVEELKDDVKELTGALTKYKGVVGGLLLAGSLIAAAITLAYQVIKLKVVG